MTTRDLTRVRWSELAELRRSPRKYQHRLSNPLQPTPAMALGSLAHCASLEPARLAGRYTIKDWDGRTSAGKARAAEVEAAGIQVVSAEDWDRALCMAESVQTHPVAGRLLAAPGQVEVELQWEDETERYGGRVDLLLQSGQVWDLKTTRDISSRACQRTIAERAYYGQLAWYRWGLAESRGVAVESIPMPGIIWVETEAPYEVRVQELSPAWISLGEKLIDELLMRRAHCMATGEWPGVSEELEVSEPPAWMLAEGDDDE